MVSKNSKISKLGLLWLLLMALLTACNAQSSTKADTVSVTNSASQTTLPSSATTKANVAPSVTPTLIATTIKSATVTNAGTVLPTPTPLSSESLRSYMDNNYQFGLVYPSDWKVSRNPGRILFSSPVSQVYGVSIDIVPGQGADVQMALQNYLNDFIKRNPDTAVSNPAQGLGHGGIASYGAYIDFAPDQTKPTNRVKAFVEKVFNEGVMYTVIASSEAAQYSERQVFLQICLDSFLPLELARAGQNQTNITPFNDFGSQFNYPKGWQVDKKTIDAGTVLTITSPASPDVNLVMQIAAGNDAVQFNSDSFQEIQKGASDYEAIQYQPQKISDTQQLSRWVILFISGKGAPIYRYIYTIADSKTNRLYSLQASAFSTRFLEYSDALIAALQSFKIS